MEAQTLERMVLVARVSGASNPELSLDRNTVLGLFPTAGGGLGVTTDLFDLEGNPVKDCRCRILSTRKLARRRSGMVRLWTFQPAQVWLELQSCGRLYVREECVTEDETFRLAYDWMREQMVRRLPDYEAHYPWWGFVGEKPDLRGTYLFFPSIDRIVRMELQLPEHRILISDYGTWHIVLARNYVWLTPSDEDRWESEETNDNGSLGAIKKEIRRSEAVASWERIFDLEALRAGGIWPATHLQGCFERLDLADVVEVSELAPR